MSGNDELNIASVVNRLPIAAAGKPPLGIKEADWWLALILPVIGFLFIELVVESGWGIGVAIFALIFAAGLLVWFRYRGIKPPRGTYGYLAWILLAAASFSLERNSGPQTLLLPLMIMAVPYFVAAACGVRTEGRLGGYLPLDAWDSLLAVPLGHFTSFFAVFGAGVKGKRGGRGVAFALLGVFLTLPAFLLVSAMLSDADAAFELIWLRLGQRITAELAENAFKVLLSIPATLYLFGLLYGTAAREGLAWREPERAAALAGRCRWLPGAMVAGGITPLLLVYIVFFCSQMAYFLNAFRGLLPAGIGYAEYARRGFFELCAVSGINLAFIGLMAFFTRRDAAGRGVEKIYTVALSLFSVGLIMISLRKMLLYIDYYGLTPRRLSTSWFMLFLLLVFVLAVVRLFRPSLNVVKGAVAAGGIMLLLFCYGNTNGWIADYNVAAYREGRLEQLDLSLLHSLGDITTSSLLTVMLDEGIDSGLRDEARHILRQRANTLGRRPEETDWRRWTLAGGRSARLLRDYQEAIYDDYSVPSISR
ncbi:MAG: DUF4173 domain-containing protein [Peptococcaceae bacterium]|jgi:hypothetical protein|nr:DUF4173 domain-containing protein [Peptococcaceae bacterium]